MSTDTPTTSESNVQPSPSEQPVGPKPPGIALQFLVTTLLICSVPIAIWIGVGVFSVIRTVISVFLLTLSLIVTLGSFGSVRAVLFSSSKDIEELWLNSTNAVLGFFFAIVLWSIWKTITPGVFEEFLLTKVIGFLQTCGALIRAL